MGYIALGIECNFFFSLRNLKLKYLRIIKIAFIYRLLSMSGFDLTYLILNSSNQCINSLYLPSSPMSLVLNIISVTHGETEPHRLYNKPGELGFNFRQAPEPTCIFLQCHSASKGCANLLRDASSGSDKEYVSVGR